MPTRLLAAEHVLACFGVLGGALRIPVLLLAGAKNYGEEFPEEMAAAGTKAGGRWRRSPGWCPITRFCREAASGLCFIP